MQFDGEHSRHSIANIVIGVHAGVRGFVEMKHEIAPVQCQREHEGEACGCDYGHYGGCGPMKHQNKSYRCCHGYHRERRHQPDVDVVNAAWFILPQQAVEWLWLVQSCFTFKARAGASALPCSRLL